MKLHVVSNGSDQKQNEKGEWILKVGSELEVECEAERSETRRLFWESTREDLDAARLSPSSATSEVSVFSASFLLQCKNV